MMRMVKGSTALYLLGAVGLCGEFPISLLDQLKGYYDYNRRRITELVQDGYLRDWRFTYCRRTIHSLSLTNKGLDTIKKRHPEQYDFIQSHLLAPTNARKDVSRAIRLHRNAACFLAATRFSDIMLDCLPPSKVDCPVYYASYMLNKRLDADSKGSRASGVVAYDKRFFVLYSLGRSNMRWNPEVERSFYFRIEELLQGYKCAGRIFIAEDWSLAESLIAHAQKKYTNLIRFESWIRSYLVTNDAQGAAIFRAIVDDKVKFALADKIRSRIALRSLNVEEPLFWLDHWACLYSDEKTSLFDETSCFDFQKAAVDRINLCDMPIQVLPGLILDDTGDQQK